MKNPNCAANLTKKGAAANPNGRPRSDWTMASLIKAALEEENESGIPRKVSIARKLAQLADAGDLVAIKEINNRTDGQSPQFIEHSGEVKELIELDTTDNKST